MESKDIIRVQEKGATFIFFELCDSCAKPITKFLISKKLIDDKTNKKYERKKNKK
ncbi:MAG: hypothetical protein WC678_00590 [Parcubacteria group bacterium]|jgi:hypothetical protein